MLMLTLLLYAGSSLLQWLLSGSGSVVATLVVVYGPLIVVASLILQHTL